MQFRSHVFAVVAGLGVASAGCGGAGSSNNHGAIDGGVLDDGGSAIGDGGGPADGSTVTGTPMMCPGPGTPKKNGGSCGSERWNIKTGTDSGASSIQLIPQPNTIAALVALPAAGAGNSREHPTETSVWELKDVTLTELKEESDSDYHLVISDGTKTMIAEVPWPGCATGSPWVCYMSRARSEIDARYTVSSSPIYPSTTITLRGVGFFDFAHGQNGVAPNAIELHPVLEICFGRGCSPD